MNEKQQEKRDADYVGPNDPDKNQTYYNNVTTNNYESTGKYTIKFVSKYHSRQRRNVVDYADLSDTVMTSLVASINQSKLLFIYSQCADNSSLQLRK